MRLALIAALALLTGAVSGTRAENPPSDTATAQASGAHAGERRSAGHLDRWETLSVNLPVSAALFPAGEAASVANSYCLTCHSVDMVLTQPPRTTAQWTETINKMRSAYGAPVPADQVGALALYLSQLRVTS